MWLKKLTEDAHLARAWSTAHRRAVAHRLGEGAAAESAKQCSVVGAGEECLGTSMFQVSNGFASPVQ